MPDIPLTFAEFKTLLDNPTPFPTFSEATMSEEAAEKHAKRREYLSPRKEDDTRPPCSRVWIPYITLLNIGTVIAMDAHKATKRLRSHLPQQKQLPLKFTLAYLLSFTSLYPTDTAEQWGQLEKDIRSRRGFSFRSSEHSQELLESLKNQALTPAQGCQMLAHFVFKTSIQHQQKQVLLKPLYGRTCYAIVSVVNQRIARTDVSQIKNAATYVLRPIQKEQRLFYLMLCLQRIAPEIAPHFDTHATDFLANITNFMPHAKNSLGYSLLTATAEEEQSKEEGQALRYYNAPYCC